MPHKKMGRPLSENPKDTRIYIRVDKSTVKKLDECVNISSTTRSDIVRKGIDMVYDDLK